MSFQFKFNTKIIIKVLVLATLIISFFVFAYFSQPNYLSNKINWYPLETLVTDPESAKYIYSNPPAQYCFNDTETITLQFNKPIRINLLQIYFPGDLHAQTSFSPSILEINAVDKNGIEQQIISTTSIKRPMVVKSLPSAITTSVIVVSAANFDNPICLAGLKLGLTSSNSFAKLPVWLYSSRYSWQFYIGLYLFFIAYVFLPAFCFLKYVKGKIPFPLAFFLYTPVIFMIINILSSVIYLYSGFTPWLYLYSAIFILSCIRLIFVKIDSHDIITMKPLLLLLIPLLITFLLMARRDYIFNIPAQALYESETSPVSDIYHPAYFADNLLPFGIARYYINRNFNDSEAVTNYLLTYKSSVIYDRTPGFPLLIMPIIKSLGNTHFVYERFLEFLAMLLPFSLFIFAKSIIPKKALHFYLLLMLNVPLFWFTMNVELFYKYLTYVPLVLALYLVIKPHPTRYFNMLIALSLSLSLLLHPSAFIYVFCFLLYILLKKRISRKSLLQAILIGILPGLLFLLWVFLPKIFPVGSELYKDYKLNYLSMITTLNVENIIKNKTITLVNLFVPNPMLIGESAPHISPLSKEYRYQFVRYSVLTNLSPLLVLLVLFLFARCRPYRLFVFCFGFAPLLTYWLLFLHTANHFYNYGGAYWVLYSFCLPIILLYFILNSSLINHRLYQLVICTYLLNMVILLKELAIFNTILKHSYVFEIKLMASLALLSFITIALAALLSIPKQNSSVSDEESM